MSAKDTPPRPLYPQPTVQLGIWGIQPPDIDPKTGAVLSEQRGDYGTFFDVHAGAPPDWQYMINGEVDRDMFMTILKIAEVRQLKRIARALEKITGIEHDEPEDSLDPKPPRET